MADDLDSIAARNPYFKAVKLRNDFLRDLNQLPGYQGADQDFIIKDFTSLFHSPNVSDADRDAFYGDLIKTFPEYYGGWTPQEVGAEVQTIFNTKALLQRVAGRPAGEGKPPEVAEGPSIPPHKQERAPRANAQPLTRTKLSPEKEQEFQRWYGRTAQEFGLSPDPDDPRHKYDYRAFYENEGPSAISADRHFPSTYKDDDHPNRVILQENRYYDTKTEKYISDEAAHEWAGQTRNLLPGRTPKEPESTFQAVIRATARAIDQPLESILDLAGHETKGERTQREIREGQASLYRELDNTARLIVSDPAFEQQRGRVDQLQNEIQTSKKFRDFQELVDLSKKAQKTRVGAGELEKLDAEIDKRRQTLDTSMGVLEGVATRSQQGGAGEELIAAHENLSEQTKKDIAAFNRLVEQRNAVAKKASGFENEKDLQRYQQLWNDPGVQEIIKKSDEAAAIYNNPSFQNTLVDLGKTQRAIEGIDKSVIEMEEAKMEVEGLKQMAASQLRTITPEFEKLHAEFGPQLGRDPMAMSARIARDPAFKARKEKYDNLRQASDTLKEILAADPDSTPDDLVKGVASSLLRRESIPFIGAALNAEKEFKRARILEKPEAQRTPDEKAFIDSLDALDAIKNNPAYQNIWNEIGEGVGFMVPYMVEYASTYGVAKTVADMTRLGIKAILRPGGMKLLTQGLHAGNLLAKGVKAVGLKALPTATGAAAQSFVNAQRIADDFARRLAPAYKVAISEDGQKIERILDASGNFDSTLAKLSKAVGTNFVEFWTEQMGGFLTSPLSAMKKFALGRFLSRHARDRGLEAMARRLGWNGIIGEFMEEYAATPFQTGIDSLGSPQGFAPRLMSGREALVTLGVVSIPGIGMAGARAFRYKGIVRAEKMAKEMNRAEMNQKLDQLREWNAYTKSALADVEKAGPHIAYSQVDLSAREMQAAHEKLKDPNLSAQAREAQQRIFDEFQDAYIASSKAWRVWKKKNPEKAARIEQTVNYRLFEAKEERERPGQKLLPPPVSNLLEEDVIPQKGPTPEIEITPGLGDVIPGERGATPGPPATLEEQAKVIPPTSREREVLKRQKEIQAGVKVKEPKDLQQVREDLLAAGVPGGSIVRMREDELRSEWRRISGAEPVGKPPTTAKAPGAGKEETVRPGASSEHIQRANAVIAEAGFKPIGVSLGHVQFNDPLTDSTLAVLASEATPDKVAEIIAKNRAKDWPEVKALRAAGATKEQINTLKSKTEAEDLIAKLGKKPARGITGVKISDMTDEQLKLADETLKKDSPKHKIVQAEIEKRKKASGKKPTVSPNQVWHSQPSMLTNEQLLEVEQRVNASAEFSVEVKQGRLLAVHAEMTKRNLKPTTQKEIVKKVVAEEPKHIKEIAAETGILEPNIRKILGMGAKDGTFERVGPGVYILKKGDESIALVHNAEAAETLEKMVADGQKVDMVFLDIPYKTAAVRGGNRGILYQTITPTAFRRIVNAIDRIVVDDDTPVIYMYSQAPSGMKQMQGYNEILLDKFVPVARGFYAKTFKDGSPATNMRGDKMLPEIILLVNKSGNLPILTIADSDLQFRLVRPKGYTSEKPQEMLEKLISMTTLEGATVLDPFAGSGVTGDAALRLRRKAILIEIDKNVVQNLIIPRLERAARDTGTGKGIKNVPRGTSGIKNLNVTMEDVGEDLWVIVEGEAKKQQISRKIKFPAKLVTDNLLKGIFKDILKDYPSLEDVEAGIKENPKLRYQTDNLWNVDADVLKDVIAFLKKRPDLAPFTAAGPSVEKPIEELGKKKAKRKERGRYANVDAAHYPVLYFFRDRGSVYPDWYHDPKTGEIRITGEFESLPQYFINRSEKPKKAKTVGAPRGYLGPGETFRPNHGYDETAHDQFGLETINDMFVRLDEEARRYERDRNMPQNIDNPTQEDVNNVNNKAREARRKRKEADALAKKLESLTSEELADFEARIEALEAGRDFLTTDEEIAEQKKKILEEILARRATRQLTPATVGRLSIGTEVFMSPTSDHIWIIHAKVSPTLYHLVDSAGNIKELKDYHTVFIVPPGVREKGPDYFDIDNALKDEATKRALTYLRANPTEAAEVILRQEGPEALKRYQKMLKAGEAKGFTKTEAGDQGEMFTPAEKGQAKTPIKSTRSGIPLKDQLKGTMFETPQEEEPGLPFTSGKDITDHIEPNTEIKQEDARKEDYDNSIRLAKRIQADYPKALGGVVPPGHIEVIAQSIANDIVRYGTAAIIGRTGESAEQIAEIMQPYRDPNFEVMRFVFTNDKGVVVHHTAWTLGLPGTVSKFPPNINTVTFGRWMQDQMRTSGATQVWAVHNHPRGDPSPSKADIEVTQEFARLMGKAFKGHVVINSNKYGVIHTGGTVSETVVKDFGPEKLLVPAKPHRLLGAALSLGWEGAALGIARHVREMEKSKGSDLIFFARGNQGEIWGIGYSSDPAILKSPSALKAAIKDFAVKTGSGEIQAGNVPIDMLNKLDPSLFTEGYLIDAVSVAGASYMSLRTGSEMAHEARQNIGMLGQKYTDSNFVASPIGSQSAIRQTTFGTNIARAFRGQSYLPIDGLSGGIGLAFYDAILGSKTFIRKLGIPSYVGNRIPALKQAFYAVRETFFEGNERYNEVANLLLKVKDDKSLTPAMRLRVASVMWRGNDEDVQKYFTDGELDQGIEVDGRTITLNAKEKETYQRLVEAQKKATDIKIDALKFYMMQDELDDKYVVALAIGNFVPGSGSVEELIDDLLTNDQIDLLQEAIRRIKEGEKDPKIGHDIRKAIGDPDIYDEYMNIKRYIKEAVIDDLARKQVERLGGYISQKRSGLWFVGWKDDDDVRHWNQYGLQSEAIAARQRLRDAGMADISVGRMQDINLAEYAASKLSLAELLDLIEELGIKRDGNVERLINEFKRLGFAAHTIRRDNTPGYDRDFDNLLKNIHDYARGAGNNLARTKGRILGFEALEKVDKKEYPADYQLVREYLETYFHSARDEASLLRKAVYASGLAWSVSFVIQQVFQPFTTHLPNIALTVGAAKAPAIMAKAMNLAYGFERRPQELNDMLSRAKVRESITGSMIEEFSGSVRLGGELIAPHVTEALVGLGASKENVQTTLGVAEKTLELAGTVTERKNREMGFIQGYLIGKERGLTGDELFKYAERWTEYVNIPYGKQNLPLKIMGGGTLKSIARLFYTYLSFHSAVLHMTGNTFRSNAPISHKIATAGYGTLSWMVLAGVGGAPMWWLVEWIYDAVMAISGRESDTRLASKIAEATQDKVPEEITTILDSGVLALAGVDLRRSLGVGEFNPLDPSRLVPITLIERGKYAFDAFGRGDFAEGIRSLPIGAPPLIRGLARVKAAASEGIKRGSEVVVPRDKLTMGQRILLGLNLTPYDVGKQFEVSQAMYEKTSQRAAKFDEMADAYAQAVFDRDPVAKKKALQDVLEYNRKVRKESPALVITDQSFEQAVTRRVLQLRYGKKAVESARQRRLRKDVEKERNIP